MDAIIFSFRYRFPFAGQGDKNGIRRKDGQPES